MLHRSLKTYFGGLLFQVLNINMLLRICYFTWEYSSILTGKFLYLRVPTVL